MSKYRIRLTLAPDHDRPEGDAGCGYEFDAPLNGVGELDKTVWQEEPDGFPVTRFWKGEDELHGRLVNRGDRLWYFHYNIYDDPDEFAHQFDSVIFREGEYVSMRDHGGEMHMFSIDSVSQIETA